NIWTQKADFGGMPRSRATGFGIGSKGYIGIGDIGYDPFPSKDFWEYDPASNTWTQKADFGGAARNAAVSFSIGNKGYLGIGFSYSSLFVIYQDFWEYDLSTDTWTRKADFPASGV